MGPAVHSIFISELIVEIFPGLLVFDFAAVDEQQYLIGLELLLAEVLLFDWFGGSRDYGRLLERLEQLVVVR